MQHGFGCGAPVDTAGQQHLAQEFRPRRAAWLARAQHRKPQIAQRIREHPRLR
jgi:hypothetical protein